MADLLKNEKTLISEFDYSKNPDIDIDTITLGSNKKVWWTCPNGHSYCQSVDKRHIRGSGCPYCSGKKVLEGFNDLCTVNPSLSKEWDFGKNLGITPQNVTLHSNKKVWWRCNICGYSWESKINDRANRQGCPKCAKEKRIKSFRENYVLKKGVNDLSTLRPDLLAEWDYDKNIDISPDDYTCGSKIKVWWKCQTCGNEWKASINNRTNHDSGCPKCKKYSRTSFPEQAILFYLQKLFPSAENSFTDIFYTSRRELDIYIPEKRVGIEYDGIAFHSDERAKKVGIEKYEVCKRNDIKLIRVSESPYETDDCDFYIYRDGYTSSSLDIAITKVVKLLSDKKIDIDSERDRREISLRYFGIIKGKSIAAMFPEIIKEWDFKKNGDITPEMVNSSSVIKYWWKCEKGHSYEMTPANKCYKKSGCPICSGRKVLSGFNDLKTKYPEIAKEWDNIKNFPIKPEEVSPYSNKKYWWICDLGHSYSAQPNNRVTNKSGCPYCTDKKVLSGYNDIATTHPEIMRYWNYSRNKEISPEQVSAGSIKKVWWKCPNGHEYEKSIASFIKYPNCPICSGRLLQKGINDLKTTHPDLAKEWDYEKNKITPESVTRTYSEKVWWKCQTCGMQWQQSVNVRVLKGIGCPKCGYKIKLGETRKRNRLL